MTNSRNAARGFTLVELLTVVAIIVLLVAVLIPAIGAARSAAKKASTSATLNTLSTGLETFRADQQIGGAYPPSASDHINQGNLTYKVNNPYDAANTLPPQQCNTEISGGSLLVWALLGADFLGCPGFKTFRTSPQPSQFWAQDTSAFPQNPAPGTGCAYSVNQTTGAPFRPRVGPLVDSSKVRVTPRNQNPPSEATIGRFPIEKEQEARQSAAITPAKRDFPFFLDAFGNPILYWRADAAGTVIADRTPSEWASAPQNLQNERGFYHFLDNGSLLARGNDLGAISGNGDDAQPLVLSPKSAAELQSGGRPHKLIKPAGIVPNQPTDPQQGFGLYIQDKNIKARNASFRADSFLLVSPGEDGIYGTGDDIANFEHNGAGLQ